MAMFGSNWKSDMEYDGLFSRWSDRTWKEDTVDVSSKKSQSVDEILDGIDISLIEKYLRKKKLQNLNKDERK